MQEQDDSATATHQDERLIRLCDELETLHRRVEALVGDGAPDSEIDTAMDRLRRLRRQIEALVPLTDTGLQAKAHAALTIAEGAEKAEGEDSIAWAVVRDVLRVAAPGGKDATRH
jgi:hypothetical protein